MYSLGIYIYSFLVRVAACLGNTKAKQLSSGQKNIWNQIGSALHEGEQRIWIHAASVGEFEQARPLLEDIREKFTQYKTVVTFFSPSGYELRKNYPGADYIFYLPYDTGRNAKRFIREVKPSEVYFIKYEFWKNYLSVIRKNHIPLYLVSANFRSGQSFFKWYGGWYRKQLKAFTRFFVQNKRSADLLAGIGYHNVTVTGDTRFDRVCRIVDNARELPEIKQFVNGAQCMVAGSTWPPDENLLVRYINTGKHRMKWIIAPHELHDSQIEALMKSIAVPSIRYSRLTGDLSRYQVLVIDNIGMLSSLYRYGSIAYIGGGFGKGIHNTLEAAAYGIPVLFGPAYKKFQEAIDLVDQGGAFSISGYDELESRMNDLFDHSGKLSEAGRIAGAFVSSGRGATQKVIQETLSGKNPE